MFSPKPAERSTYVLSTLGRGMSTMKRDQLMAEKVLAGLDVIGDSDKVPAILVLNPVLSPETLTPRKVVVAGLVGLLGAVEAFFGDLEELGVGGVELGALSFARGQVGNGRTLGVRPLLLVWASITTPADTNLSTGRDFRGQLSRSVAGRGASNVAGKHLIRASKH